MRALEKILEGVSQLVLKRPALMFQIFGYPPPPLVIIEHKVPGRSYKTIGTNAALVRNEAIKTLRFLDPTTHPQFMTRRARRSIAR